MAHAARIRGGGSAPRPTINRVGDGAAPASSRRGGGGPPRPIGRVAYTDPDDDVVYPDEMLEPIYDRVVSKLGLTQDDFTSKRKFARVVRRLDDEGKINPGLVDTLWGFTLSRLEAGAEGDVRYVQNRKTGKREVRVRPPGSKQFFTPAVAAKKMGIPGAVGNAPRRPPMTTMARRNPDNTTTLSRGGGKFRTNQQVVRAAVKRGLADERVDKRGKRYWVADGKTFRKAKSLREGLERQSK